jgi:predicted metal-dependent hydrolase
VLGFRRNIARRRRRRPAGQKKYEAYKEAARALVRLKLARFNAYYDFKLNRVFIKNSRSRWGSCSNKGNLNFNYRILFLRPELQDYLIVHELCHLRHFNHSADFWALVAEQVPDYKALRREIRKILL